MCVMVFYLCAKVIIIVASQQLHPNVGFGNVRIVDRVVSVMGYSIRREPLFYTFVLPHPLPCRGYNTVHTRVLPLEITIIHTYT